MKNLTGCLKKTLLKFSLLIPSFFLFYLLFLPLLNQEQSLANESEDFRIHSSFEHTLTEDEIKTDVILQIRSETAKVISYYNATIPLQDIRVVCQNLNTGETLSCDTFDRGSTTDVLVNLNNSVTRPDSPLEIKVSYSTPIIARSYNLMSEVYDTTTNSVLIRYPKELGQPLWTSDPIENIRAVGENFEVLINRPTTPRISLLFGEKLLYRFEINKVFSNTLNNENQTFEIYVPPDTPTQTIIWDEITPEPNSTLKDEDGNYIFKYIVPENETVDCKITGYILKTESIEEEFVSSISLTQTRGYWSINNSTEFRRVNNFLRRRGLDIQDNFQDVKDLTEEEREIFYKYLYRYVVDRLNYEEDMPLGIGAEIRLGANTVVDTSNGVSSIDYADYYISLLRNYNIPSRLVVGYVSNITGYTSDGFYHHWVEYFDTDQNKWITADPFLEDYFKKDLFGSSFLDHITVLRRGASPVAPKMTFFQETDFIVNTESDHETYPDFSFEADLAMQSFKATDELIKAHLHVLNTGNIAINSYDILSSNIDNLRGFIDPVNNLQSQIILPGQRNSIQFNIPYESLEGGHLFIHAQFNNLNKYAGEELMEIKTNENIPMYLSLISKGISIVIFGAILFLIYFSVRKISKSFRKKKGRKIIKKKSKKK